MKRKIYIPISVIIFLGIGIWSFVNQKSAVTVGTKNPEYEITAEKLYMTFSENETEANKIYLNKVIKLTGKVQKAEHTEEGVNVYLSTEGESSGVICNFEPGVVDTDDFDEQNNVTIQGLCSGYLFDVVLVKCDLVR